ncbi:MAG: hypothetical protein ABSC72_12710, partial [Methylovirgula sp.]
GRDLVGHDFWVRSWTAAIERLPVINYWNRSAEHYRGPAAQMGMRFIVADDVRFQNEVDAIHARGGIVIEVKRPLAKSELGAEHLSEHRAFTPDRVLTNDDHLAVFLAKVDALAESLRA